MMAIMPPWLRLNDEPLSEPEAPAFVSTALPEPALPPLEGVVLAKFMLLGKDEAVDIAGEREVDDTTEVEYEDCTELVTDVEVAWLC